MIKLSNFERNKLTELSNQLKQCRDRDSYFKCLNFTAKTLQRIYTDGYVVCLNLLPELNDCVKVLSKYRGETEYSFIGSIDGLKAQHNELPITSSQVFKIEYQKAKKHLFYAADCLKFYLACETIAKYCGTTPSETNANFILSRIMNGKTFNFENHPIPNREKLLVYFVECAKKGINPIRKATEKTNSKDKLPESYMFYLSTMIAKNEQMTVSEWFERRIKPLAKGISIPMPYMLANEKAVRDSLSTPDKDKIYFRKVVHYISWNKLPKDIIINALPDFAQDNKFLQVYKTAPNFQHKLHKPISYRSAKIYSKITELCQSNENNFIGNKDIEFYKATISDIRLFIGDSNIYQNPPTELKLLLDRLVKALPKDFNIVEYLKKYDNKELIEKRLRFITQNNESSNITTANPASNIENEFVSELMSTYQLGLLPEDFFSMPLGKRASRIAMSKNKSPKDYIASLEYTFAKTEQECLIKESEIFNELAKTYPDKKIASSVFQTDPLYFQVKAHARIKKLTLKQYFAANGYTYVAGFTTQQEISEEAIKSLLLKDFPNKNIAVPLNSLPYLSKINNAALRAKMKPTEYVKSLGFSISKRKTPAKDSIKSQLHAFATKEGVISEKIKGTKVYSDILNYAKKHNMSVFECYSYFGYKSGYRDIRNISEKEFWNAMEEEYPSRILPRDFERTLNGQKCQRLAKSQNKDIFDYIEEHNFRYAKVKRNTNSEEEIMRVMWLNYPNGIITDRQFFKTELGQYITLLAKNKDVNTFDYLRSKGFGIYFINTRINRERN